MRVLAIGDIHGYLGPLDSLLETVVPGPNDWIVTLGDYVDRGPDTKGVLDRMLELHETGRLVALRGNHDLMMVGAKTGKLDGWLAWAGGQESLDSYVPKGFHGTVADIPDRHIDFLENKCADWHEIDSHFFVHANVDPYLPLNQQRPETLFWEKLVEPRSHMSGKIMVCGHTPQKSGAPLNWGHTICLDTFVYGDGGWLTCLDVVSGNIWQTNRNGQKRTGNIDVYRKTP